MSSWTASRRQARQTPVAARSCGRWIRSSPVKGDGTIAFKLQANSAGTVTVEPGGAHGDWVLVSVRHDASRLYITANGVSANTGAAGNVSVSSDTQRLLSSASNQRFIGQLASFFVADRAFTDDEMLSMTAFYNQKFAL